MAERLAQHPGVCAWGGYLDAGVLVSELGGELGESIESEGFGRNLIFPHPLCEVLFIIL